MSSPATIVCAGHEFLKTRVDYYDTNALTDKGTIRVTNSKHTTVTRRYAVFYTRTMALARLTSYFAVYVALPRYRIALVVVSFRSNKNGYE